MNETKSNPSSLIFQQKNYFQDDKVYFCPKKLTLKTDNGQFLTVLNQVVLQDIKTFFEDANLNAQFY